MRIFVSAAEISSDLQAEKILNALTRLFPEGSVEIAGIGGPMLRSLPRFHCIQRAEEMRAMGFTEVLTKLRLLNRTLNHSVQFIRSFKPDLILTFDYPDFHLKLLKKVGRIRGLEQTLKICGIPPKIWVWRFKRLEKIKKYYNAVWVIFPFEESIYASRQMPVIYAGNPLVADILKSTAKQRRNDLDEPGRKSLSVLSAEPVRLAVLPGSREAELRYHLPVIPETLERLANAIGKTLVAEVPVPKGLPMDALRPKLIDTEKVKYLFSQGNSVEILARNEFGLIKSGTSTLEAAVLGCVPVVFYKVSKSTEWIFRLFIRYAGPVALPNILLGIKDRAKGVFSEFLGPEASPARLSEALAELYRDSLKRKALQAEGASLRAQLVPVADVSLEVARQMKRMLEVPPPPRFERKKHFFIGFVSFLWSSLNAVRHWAVDQGLFSIPTIPIRSVLVGNLQAGGAGKTPIVIEIAKRAVKEGFQVGVISRAYGVKLKSPLLVVAPAQTALATEVGDEPAEIRAAVPEVTLGLGTDRVKLAEALQKRGIDFLIFDDGFQNLKFKTQFTVLAVTNAKRNEVIYRDFDAHVGKANLIVQTKGTRDPRWPAQTISIKWEAQALPLTPLWLYCGVADPHEVVHFYRSLGVVIKNLIAKSDHAPFDEHEAETALELAREDGAQLAMTPKDKVKLPSAKFSTVFVLKRKIKNTDWLDPIFKR